MLLAVFLFMRKMIKFSDVSVGMDEAEDYDLPRGVEVFEITGPLFFGAAYKFREAIKLIEKPPKILVIRMRQVPIIDATGVKTIMDVYKEFKAGGTRIILCEVTSEQVMNELREARILDVIGQENITASIDEAMARCNEILPLTT
jgi:SulP family sulfate permease